MEKMIELDPKVQMEIFERVFLHMLDYPSSRLLLKKMIEFQDGVDEAELDLKLRKLELEIIKGGRYEE